MQITVLSCAHSVSQCMVLAVFSKRNRGQWHKVAGLTLKRDALLCIFSPSDGVQSNPLSQAPVATPGQVIPLGLPTRGLLLHPTLPALQPAHILLITSIKRFARCHTLTPCQQHVKNMSFPKDLHAQQRTDQATSVAPWYVRQFCRLYCVQNCNTVHLELVRQWGVVSGNLAAQKPSTDHL